MPVLFEKQKIALERLDKTQGRRRKKLGRHAIDIAEGHRVGEMLAKIVVEGGSAVPATREVFSPCIALSRCCERAPHVGADHRTGNELICIPTRKKTLR